MAASSPEPDGLGTTEHTGYSAHIFDQDWLTHLAHLRCVRKDCGNILKEPLQAQCGHRLCKACVEIIRQRPAHQHICDGCVEESNRTDFSTMVTMDYEASIIMDSHLNNAVYPLNVFSMIADKAAQREIRRMLCVCPSIGCSEPKMPLYKYEIHAEQCHYAAVICDECRISVRKCDMVEHRLSECEMRLVECEYGCGTTTMARDLLKHRRDCPKRLSICPICFNQIPLNGQEDHYITRCIAKCPFGCEEQEPVLAREHLSQPALMFTHMTGLHTWIKSLQLSTVKLPDSISEEEKINLELTADRVLTLDAKAERTKAKVEAFFRQGSQLRALNTDSIQQILQSSRQFDQTEAKMSELENLIRSLAADINELHHYQQDMKDTSLVARQLIENKLTKFSQALLLREAIIKDQKLSLDALMKSSDDGTFLWKITNCHQEQEKAKRGSTYSLFSPPFSSSPYGYRMCMRVYFNGDGQGKNSHLSLFLSVMRGEYDALLPWPFMQHVTMSILDQSIQKNHITEEFNPDGNSSSFQRPKTEMNVASGCPKFAPLSQVFDPNRGYVVDDTMFISVKVDSHVPDAIHDVGPPDSGFHKQLSSTM